MKAILLALEEVGQNPTCLMNYKGKTLLQTQIEALQSLDIKDIVIVTGSHYQKIKDLKLEDNIKVIPNYLYKTTGTVISLDIALESIDKEPFILVNDGFLPSKELLESILKYEEDIIGIYEDEMSLLKITKQVKLLHSYLVLTDKTKNIEEVIYSIKLTTISLEA